MIDNFVLNFSSPGSIALSFGNIEIRWYGILIATGFLISYLFAEHLVKKNNLNIDTFSNLILLILFSSIVFARLWFVFLSWDYYGLHLDEIPKIWYGGQSIHGGLFGGILIAYFYLRFKKQSFYKYMDIIAVCVQLEQSIGSWGNIFNN
jgi:phosphatidylglycerol:prolipoprotein diacylglycerol transferase